MRTMKRLLPLLAAFSVTAAAPPAPSNTNGPVVHMLIPGFTVRELPIKLTSLNNIEYGPDGRLFAAGYDGRFHLLRDTDSDGLEDRVITFSPEPSPNYPLGLVVKDGIPYSVLTDEIVRFRDTDGDGVPDKRETVVKGFDDPELVKAPYLVHRRVDSSMAITFGPDGSLYTTMGNSAPFNAYWTDKAGVAHYTPEKRRGSLLRFGLDGKMEQLATGLRYIMSLQWNRHGDLFGTDQEGATWVPNGNPFDELLHIQTGRHYGFPPRHPKFLPDVVDEPSVWDYEPQHQSTCGFRFNGPIPGRGRFGPGFWADDAIVTGEARGRLWRTKLAKTAAGYVAHSELFARIGMLVVDCAISPNGDLVICCHSGAPDWGNGPTGEGRVFKISHTDLTAPQPVLTWPSSPTETTIAFDRKLTASSWNGATTTITSGRFVDAADRLETIRPGYAVVKMQQEEKPGMVTAKPPTLGKDGRSLTVQSDGRSSAVKYALAIQAGPDSIDVAHNLSGLEAAWRGRGGSEWKGWLPHPDFMAAKEFTKSSAAHDALWQRTATAGTLTLRAQLDLWQMLLPATQPGSKLDYTPEPETVSVTFKSDAVLKLETPGARIERISDRESRLTIAGPREAKWLPISLTVATPAKSLEVAYSTTRDPRPRSLATRRFLVPFATPPDHLKGPGKIPEIAGGDWNAGHRLFLGKAACATCHQLRGEGARVGPELGNLVHRDYASVLNDIADPGATINPDGGGYVVTLKNGDLINGTRLAETDKELQIAQAGGAVAKIRKSDIVRAEPMTTSLMPAGFDKSLTPAELRDLMTFLLTEKP